MDRRCREQMSKWVCLLSYVDVGAEVEEGILINQIHSFTLGGGSGDLLRVALVRVWRLLRCRFGVCRFAGQMKSSLEVWGMGRWWKWRWRWG